MNDTANIEHEVETGWHVKIQDAQGTRATRGVVFVVTGIERSTGKRVALLKPISGGRTRKALTWTLERIDTPSECESCGVQLNPDGTVDNLDGEPAAHYADCRKAEIPTYDEIEAGQIWYVEPRCMFGTVINKFRSVSAAPGRPVGTEYVELIDANGMGFFNYPHQLRAQRPTR